MVFIWEMLHLAKFVMFICRKTSQFLLQTASGEVLFCLTLFHLHSTKNLIINYDRGKGIESSGHEIHNKKC